MEATEVSTNRWMDKVVVIYTMDYYSIIKNEILPFATRWMDLDIMVNKSDREEKCCYHLCVESKKCNEWIY